MSTCLFCKIAAGQIPSRKLYEDEELLAFHDIAPHAPVHFLIVPKLHLATLSDAQAQHSALLGKMLVLAAALAKEQGCHVQYDEAGQPSGGYKALINSGPDGGQEVYHLHLHVIGGAHPWRAAH